MFFTLKTTTTTFQLHLQHSLVSEIRDIVYPEDRLRFDELMFRHGVTVNVLSNNVATLYGRSGVCSYLFTFFIRAINSKTFLFYDDSQGVFKNRIGSRGSDAQLNHSGLHSVCTQCFVCV